jgi:hypothetical protein
MTARAVADHRHARPIALSEPVHVLQTSLQVQRAPISYAGLVLASAARLRVANASGVPGQHVEAGLCQMVGKCGVKTPTHRRPS